MSDQWGTRKQPPEPSTNRTRPERESGLRVEHAYLLLAVISVSSALVLYAVDYQVPNFQANIGVYPILLSFFIAGYGGWLTHSSERRMRRIAVNEFRQLSAEIEELRGELRRQQATVNRPGQHTPNRWPRREVAAAGGGQVHTVPAASPRLDPGTEAALRRINMRLLKRTEG